LPATIQNYFMKCIQITLSGDIYGSGMRFGAMHFANEVGVKGYAQYNRRGDIIIEAEGEEGQLREYIRWCREGPPSLVVSGVEVRETEIKWYTSFDIRHGLHGGGTLSDKPAQTKRMRLFFNRVWRVFSSDKHAVTEEIQ